MDKYAQMRTIKTRKIGAGEEIRTLDINLGKTDDPIQAISFPPFFKITPQRISAGFSSLWFDKCARVRTLEGNGLANRLWHGGNMVEILEFSGFRAKKLAKLIPLRAVLSGTLYGTI